MAKNESELEDSTLSERFERQQLAQLVQSAGDKIIRGEDPSRDEVRALKKFEREQLKSIGQKYLTSVPKTQFLQLFQGSTRAYIDWRDSYGFPWPENQKDGVDVREVMRFYRSRFAQGGVSLPPGADEDDILLQFASQDLKDELVRHRIREKDVTNRIKSLDLQKALEDWAPIEPIREWHNTLAELILRTREKIVKDLDGERKERAEQAFDDLGDDMARLVEDQFGGDSDTDSNGDA